MEIKFANRELKQIYSLEYKKLPAKIRKKYPKKIVDNFVDFCNLLKITDIKEIAGIKGYNLEKLQGRTKEYSIRLNKQYRFEFKYNSKENSITGIRISKHYEK